MAKAAVLQMEKTDGSKLDDNQVIEVLAKEVKQRRDAMQEFENGKRQDLALKKSRNWNLVIIPSSAVNWIRNFRGSQRNSGRIGN